MPTNAAPLRVLLVDDHPVSRAACRALLRTQGADVIADVAPGEEAIAIAEALWPDVAIVDVTPDDDRGVLIARRLRGLASAPAVVLTSSADPSVLDGVLDGYAFLAKADICHETILDAVDGDESPT